MVRFWVAFALIVAAIGAASNLDVFAAFNPFNINFNVRSTSGERGSGVEKSEIRRVDAFTRIHAEGSGTLDVDVKSGNPTGTLEISADDNLLGFLSTRVVDGILEVTQTASMNPKSRMRLKVSAPSLEGIHLEGANTLNLTIDSSNSLELHMEGAGRVKASGKVGPLSVHSEGAGSVDTSELVSREVDVTIEGAGHARVNATEILRGRIGGAGTITYLGDPQTVEREIEGIGRISKAN